MLRRPILLAIVVAVAATAAIPATASAEWTYKGNAIEQDEIVPFDGPIELVMEKGTIDCKQAGFELEMTAGTTDGHLLFLGANPAECEVGGQLAALCGKGVVNVNSGGKPTAKIVGGVIVITKVELSFQLEAPCAAITFTDNGGIVGTPNNKGNIELLKLAGNLKAGLVNAAVSGEMTPQILEYGIE